MLDLVNKVEIKTNQGALDFVILHLLNQNVKSECEGSCYYRSKIVTYYGGGDDYDYNEYEFSGKACAAGALIKDSEYNENFENEPASDPHVIEAIKASHPDWNFDDNSITMVLTLQKIHDSHAPFEWPLLLKFFKEFCEKRNFNFNETPEQIMEKVESESYRYLKNHARGFLALENNELRKTMIGEK